MVEIKKSVDGLNNNEYKIITDKGAFQIIFGGDLDLYWRFIYDEERKDEYTIDITKEKYFLYNLFDQVYDSIASCNPTKYCDDKLSNPLRDEMWLSNKGAQRSKENLLDDNGITWLSDDGMVEDAASVNIKKCDDKYEVTFKRGYSEGNQTYGVRFSNSGSRYMPFNATFGIMYNKLKNYDDEDCQIHIEEYIYNEKVKKLKK